MFRSRVKNDCRASQERRVALLQTRRRSDGRDYSLKLVEKCYLKVAQNFHYKVLRTQIKSGTSL
jgi:hypothetical protein